MFILDKKMNNFLGANGNLLVKVFVVSYLEAIATVDVHSACNYEVKLVEIRTVYFE